MSGSTRAGLAAVLLVVVWIVVYWRTTPSGGDPKVPAVVGGAVEPPPTGGATLAGAPTTRAEAPIAPPVLQTSMPSSAPSPTPAPVEPPPQPQAKPGETIPPTFDLYEVQPGDNAQAISKKRYGTTKHWRAILKANPLLDFTRLRPGRVIKVPHDPDNTQGVVVPDEKGDDVEYTVTEGDTLSGIARALYGKSAMWRTILEANPELNEDGTNLRPGMKLRIPPPEKAAGVR